MDYIVIGAGPAGVVAAEYLRKYDPDGNVAIIGEEPEPPYSRMAIPYYLKKNIDESGTYLRKGADYYAQERIEIVRDRVAVVDTDARKLSLESGDSRNYDRLVVATGASPVTPPIPGIDLPGVYNCWTLADARNIFRLMEPGNNVVLIGAGFIGSIILEALAAGGVNLTVVETENRMVPRMMNETAGGMIRDWCVGKGVNVLTSTRVQSIEEGSPLSVELDNGSRIPAHMVITATGVSSNIGFLNGSSIDVDEGIVVDEFMQTNNAQIYAVGDCAQGKDFSTGGFNVQAIQPTAVEHGKLAAANIVYGHGEAHRGQVNMNVLDTLGLVSSSFGMWMGTEGGDGVERIDRDRYRYINLQFKDDRLVGASTLGLTDHVGVIRGLIQSEIRLKDWKRELMNDPTRLMEAYLASTQAFG